MTNKDFERYFKTFISRAESKSADFSTLTREEKINHLASKLNFVAEGVEISSVKTIDASKLSKDIRFQLIQEATMKQDLNLVTKLAMGSGEVEVHCSTPFNEATISSQLAYLEKEYINTFGSLPTEIEVEILGGDNFRKFIEYCNNLISQAE